MKTIIVSVGMTIAHCVNGWATEPSDKLVRMAIMQESSGNDKALGDKHLTDKAYGPLQIRKPCLTDVNRRYGTKYRPEDMFGNRELSIWVFKKYIGMYATRKALGREPTMQDMARIWNGGPTGWKRESTLKYWSDIQRFSKETPRKTQ
jgi:hypothetical protein